MALDIDNLGPAPDLDAFDAGKLDRGDSLEAPPPPEEDKKELDAEEKEVVEDLTKDKEPEVEEEDKQEEGEEEQARDEKGRFTGKGVIPMERHKATLDKEREAREVAERRAAELERQLAQRQQQEVNSAKVEELENSITALEKKHAELLLDGNVDEAAKVMREIRVSERQIARAEAEEMANRKVAQTLEADRMEATIARVEADYPMLNPESEQFDEDLVELVLSKQRALMQREGYSPSKAMAKAASDVMERFGKPQESTKEDPKGLAAAKAAEDRKAEQIKRNLDTQKKQPASMKEVGIDSDKAGQVDLPDVTKMTQDEFAALPESTKAKLRGDYV